MSTQTCDQLMEKQIIYTESAVPVEKSTRNVFTSRTGQVLVALGTLFKHVPPFNESIDNSTSETLISIGRKLKSTK